MPDTIELLGWAGMVLLLVAYANRNTFHVLPYSALNIAGSLLIAVLCWKQDAWPPFGLQIAWIAIALRDIARWVRRPDRASKSLHPPA
ncbi:MAG: hypothetical protein AAFX79_13415 [Planctomycetota bacterium]